MLDLLRRFVSGQSPGSTASAPRSQADGTPVDTPPLEWYLQDELNRSPFFKPEARERVLQSCINGASLSKSGAKLTAEQKRELGLNPRLALTQDLIDVLSVDGLSLPDPKRALEDTYVKASNRRSREDTVTRARRIGFNKFKWRPVNDVSDCTWCASNAGKTFAIDILAQIETNCACLPYSRCYIEPVLDELC